MPTELAESERTGLVHEMSLEHFHFSQLRGILDIGWKESGKDVELRVHIESAECDKLLS